MKLDTLVLSFLMENLIYVFNVFMLVYINKIQNDNELFFKCFSRKKTE